MSDAASSAPARRGITPLVAFAGVLTVVSVAATLFAAARSSDQVSLAARDTLAFEVLHGEIVLYDEALTMSARLGALSAHPGWRARYEVYAGRLAIALEEVTAYTVDPDALVGVKVTSRANEILVARELNAFALADLGRHEEAAALLSDSTYSTQKLAYAAGMEAYLKAVSQRVAERFDAAKGHVVQTVVLAGLLILINAGMWALLIYRARGQAAQLSKAHADLEDAHKALASRSRQREASFFDDAPMPLIETSFAHLVPVFETLRAAGYADFRSWAEANPAGAADLMARCAYLGANDAALALLKIDTIDQLRANPHWFFKSHFMNATTGFFDAFYRGETVFRDESRVFDANFGEIPVIVTARVARGHEAAGDSIILSFTDISAQTRTNDALSEARDAAQAANRAKSEFLAQMSHEIRTPMNGVLGMASALARTPLSDKQRRMLGVVEQSGAGLLAVLNDLLDLSKIEAGRLDLEYITFDVESLVRGAHALFSERAAEKNLAFTVAVAPAARGYFLGDPGRLRQVLHNMISNAVKFTAAGAVAVTVDARPTEEDGAHELVFSVRDSGPGMSKEMVAKLFQPFTQEDASTTRRFGGTGLGLAICKQLAELMNGTVAVDTAPGAGSTFTFTARVDCWAEAETPMEVGGETEPEEVVDPQEERPLRILAAEDNAQNRLVLEALLEPTQAEIAFAHDGAQAVAAWRDGAFDLILMDIQMPVMDGVDAARAIRGQEAATARTRTPIIALTANAMRHQLDSYLAAGMDGCVTKPIAPATLFREIMTALAGGAHTEAA